MLPGRVPGSGEYLGREAFVLVIGMSCRNEKGKNLYGVNDVVCNSASIATDDRRSGAKPWACG